MEDGNGVRLSGIVKPQNFDMPAGLEAVWIVVEEVYGADLATDPDGNPDLIGGHLYKTNYWLRRRSVVTR